MYVKGKQGHLHRLIFEARFRFGFAYLDYCGRILNRILQSQPKWTLLNNVNPQGGSLVHLTSGCKFNFSATRLDFSLEKPANKPEVSPDDVESMLTSIDEVASVVVEQLGLSDFSRIGFRAVYFFETDSPEASEKWLTDLGCFSVNPALATAMDSKIESTSAAMLLGLSDRKVRIHFSAVERVPSVDIGQTAFALDDDHAEFEDEVRTHGRLLSTKSFGVFVDMDGAIRDCEGYRGKEFAKSSLELFGKMLDAMNGLRKS